MISILIPTYNYKVLQLAEAIHKQAENSGIPFELCVFDDGSPQPIEDNQLINKLPYAKFEVMEQNVGRTAIRTQLAIQAKYAWLLFLDSDVLPYSENFIANYLAQITHNQADVVFGGVTYAKDRPDLSVSLRWHYGKKREAKSVIARQKSPYFIISQNLLIKKDTFLKANIVTENYYGLDNLFSNQLKRQHAKVLHLDNPVIHLGLEDNSSFVKKSLKAVETTVIFEEKGLMDDNLRPIQKSYLLLKRWRLQWIVGAVSSCMKKIMEKNFESGSPNLHWFDFYRLNHYIQLKKNKRA